MRATHSVSVISHSLHDCSGPNRVRPPHTAVSPAAATAGAATDASFPPPLPPPASRRRRRGVVAAVVVAVATTTAVAAATTVAAATDTVDRKEARVVRARAHALPPRMRIERERPVSLFLPPLRGVSARAASSSSSPAPVFHRLLPSASFLPFTYPCLFLLSTLGSSSSLSILFLSRDLLRDFFFRRANYKLSY